jgi:indolepyruvate decarboxylase
MAKSYNDETCSVYHGMYNGKIVADLKVREFVESTDLIMHIGSLMCDSNTGGWNQEIGEETLIILRPRFVTCAGKPYDNVHSSLS